MNAVILHHVCTSCCHPLSCSPENPRRTARCEMCGHNGEGQIRSTFRNQYGQLKVVTETKDTMNHELLQKVLNSVVSIKEYWNGSPESAVDAIETAIERADNAEINLREWLNQNPSENNSTWLCGCGSWSGVNLPTCAVCGRNRNSDQKP